MIEPDEILDFDATVAKLHTWQGQHVWVDVTPLQDDSENVLRGPQFGEPLAVSLGRAGHPFDRHAGRKHEDTLDDLVAEGYRFIELGSVLDAGRWDGVRDCIECIPDDLGLSSTAVSKIAFLWASSTALDRLDRFNRPLNYDFSAALGWLTDSLLALEYDPEAPMRNVLVAASERAPARFQKSHAMDPWDW